MGVTALTRKTLLPDMRVLTAREGFPALEPIRIGLFYKHQRLSGAGLMLVDSLISRMDEAAEPAPQGSRRSISGHHAFISSINFPHGRCEV